MKFKVGDKVRVKELRDVCGLVFTVTECDEILRCYRISRFDRFGHETRTVFIEDMLEPVCDAKIVITTDGKETLARLYEDGNVVKKATAQCSPDDKFDFAVGAKIAFERLTKTTPAKIIMGKKYRVIGNTEPRHHYNLGEIVTPIEIDLGSAYYESIERGRHQWVSNKDVELVEEPAEPKYYSGKVVCVEKKKEHYSYTVGKIYEFKNGRVKLDNGRELLNSTRVTSLDEWNDSDWAGAKFIELKE